MATPLTSPAERLVRAAGRVRETVAATDVAQLSDDALTAALKDAADGRHAADLVIATLSGDVDRRSARDRGREGLAQRTGHRSGASLVQTLTGQTKADVTRALQTGRDLVDVDAGA